jgi:hypothetical protein
MASAWTACVARAARAAGAKGLSCPRPRRAIGNSWLPDDSPRPKSNMGRCFRPQASATNMMRWNGVFAITTERARRSARGLLLRSFQPDLISQRKNKKNFYAWGRAFNRVFVCVFGGVPIRLQPHRRMGPSGARSQPISIGRKNVRREPDQEEPFCWPVTQEGLRSRAPPKAGGVAGRVTPPPQ